MRCDFLRIIVTIHSKSHPKSHFIENLYFCLKRIAYLCTEIAIYWINCSRSA